MNNNFKIEKSVYIMMGLVALIGLFFLLIRSDFILTFRSFSEVQEVAVLQENEEKIKEDYKQASFLIIEGEDQPELAKTITSQLKQMGKVVDTRPIDQNFSSSEKYEGIIVATEQLDDLPDIQPLLTYVEAGGSLFFATRPSPGVGLSSIYQQLGIVEIGSFIETSGIELTKPFLKAMHNEVFSSEDIVNSSLSVRVGQEASMYAISTDGTPLLWETSYGGGKFVFFNGTMLANPSQNGLLTKGIQLMVPTFIYPVINAKVTALEGFPSPVQEGNNKNSNMTNENYLRHSIWAELQRIEAKYDLNYTTSFVLNSGNTSEQANSGELLKSQENAVIYGRELLRMGGEFGVRGYSQLPTSGFKKTDVKSMFQATYSVMERALPGYQIQSYIPVNQENALANLHAVKEVFPDLQAVLAEVEQPFIEEQGMAVLPKQIKSFPADDYAKWMAFNGLYSTGFVSQSLEPQALLYQMDAEVVLQDLASYQKQLKENAPWLRSETLSNTLTSVQNYEDIIIYEERTEDGISFQVNKLKAPAYFFLSSDRPVNSYENCKVTAIGPNLYLIEANEVAFHIGWEG
ncbi:DUF2194 domain-containing protein [Metabacillus halosaccharovorans]|uniref:DUF2194 domain-containing protein n=1 Tax=Metabacillus halosaccharovorans TaxID=930124 RepID=UPI001C1FCAAD|nr:DUF2194 domain-containing protein [Metabacillus halosaccharovorans]MBU7594435.1 DUF2194 domain-containing protein [Metabacillus halosaccharovorans]